METNTFSRFFFFGIWNEVSSNILNNNVALTSVQDSNKYTEHFKSNLYIPTFVKRTHN